MKKIIKHIIVTILAFVIAYLIVSFISWEIQPTKLTEEAIRFNIVLAFFTIGLFLNLVVDYYDDNN